MSEFQKWFSSQRLRQDRIGDLVRRMKDDPFPDVPSEELWIHAVNCLRKRVPTADDRSLIVAWKAYEFESRKRDIKPHVPATPTGKNEIPENEAWPKTGEIWKHSVRGSHYRIQGVYLRQASDASDKELVVVYVPRPHPVSGLIPTWLVAPCAGCTRPLREWFESIPEADGAQRFVRVD